MAAAEKKSERSDRGEFVHLHLHSDYSLLQSAIQIKSLAKKLVELDIKACAITDYGNMYGAVTFHNVMVENGIKPIIGYEAHIASGSSGTTQFASGELPYFNLVLLAENQTGYENLVRLASTAFTEGSSQKPHITLEALQSHSSGIIALSSGFKGALWHYLSIGERKKATEYVQKMQEIFGGDSFFGEVQDHGSPAERAIIKELIELNQNCGLRLVATNDAHYLTRDDARAHEVLMCIGSGQTVEDSSHPKFDSEEYYVKSKQEMWELFGRTLPEAISATVEISDRCNVSFPKNAPHHLPQYPIPDNFKGLETDRYFEEVVMDGFKKRHASVWAKKENNGNLKYGIDHYEERVRAEIKMISEMGFPGYFLIVWDFIKYAKENGIPVGPGRGSAAGSLVAYCLEITDVDPIEHDLLFERFLNPERISMPDIDVDFCIRGRGEVIDHVTRLYGRESVCQIVTFGTMASRAAIKDVGRALNVPFGEVEKIAKLIPPPIRGRNVSISKALEDVPELKRLSASDPKVNELLDLALRLEGCSRHTSVHAAGVVISPKPLYELVPVAVSAKNELTSQFPMTDLEKVGMLKMDFLGLTTLTVIQDCLKSLKDKEGVEIDWALVPDRDPEAMKIFGDGRTDAIFQFESSGMQEICRRLKPKELEDLAALNALYRPGPLDGGMVDDFIKRHRGETTVSYIVPEMKEVLENTYGILVYQEQIMQLAQKLGGYSLGEADMMRRAMGKKKREEMVVHEEKFVAGAVERGIREDKARKIFELMERFADYGFNRSHSVAYAYVAYQTAYLKAHHATHFYASVLSHEANDTAKVYKYSNELKASGLTLLPPDINESGEGFTPLHGGVRYGLTAIKGLGSSSVSAIIAARATGHFTSIFDFTQRIPANAINRRSLESLIFAGAFDSLKPEHESVGGWRARLHASIDLAVSVGQRAAADREKGQNNLFGSIDTESVSDEVSLINAEAWSEAVILSHEKDAVGFYLSSHPLDAHADALAMLGIATTSSLIEMPAGKRVRVAGIVTGAAFKYSRKGNRFSIFQLEDQTGSVKCLAWSEACTKYFSLLADDEQLLLDGKIESNDGTDVSFVLDSATRLADALPKMSTTLEIEVPEHAATEASFEKMLTSLAVKDGECAVVLKLALDNGIVVEVGGLPFSISGSSEIDRILSEKGCKAAWSNGGNGGK